MYVSATCSCKSNNFILLEQNRVVRFFVTCISILYSVYLWNDNSVMLARISIKSKYWWASHFHECGVFALHNRIMNQTFSSFENLQLWEQKIIFIQQKIGKKFLTFCLDSWTCKCSKAICECMDGGIECQSP